MSTLESARQKLRSELEAPPALCKFGSGWINGLLGLVLGLATLLGGSTATPAAPAAAAGPEPRHVTQ